MLTNRSILAHEVLLTGFCLTSFAADPALVENMKHPVPALCSETVCQLCQIVPNVEAVTVICCEEILFC